jgi:hypothetical protein
MRLGCFGARRLDNDALASVQLWARRETKQPGGRARSKRLRRGSGGSIAQMYRPRLVGLLGVQLRLLLRLRLPCDDRSGRCHRGAGLLLPRHRRRLWIMSWSFCASSSSFCMGCPIR